MKRYLTYIILSIISLSALSQRQYTPKFYIGGKAGVTLSQMTFEPSIKQSMLTGYMGGLTFKYTEEKHFGLIAEILIEQRGWSEDFEEHPFSYDRTLTYLQIPLLTHIYFGNDKFKGFFNLGPEVGYLISDNISANFDYNNINSVPNFPIRNRMTEQLYTPVKNKFDYGISGGLGGEFSFKQKHAISLEARYYFGLGNIYPDNKKDTFSASRSMSIMVTLGYSFRLK